MVTKTYSPIFLTLKIKCNWKHFYISFLVNLSSRQSNEKIQKSVRNVLMESVKRCHRLVTVKETDNAPVIAVCIRNVLKENNLMTVKNIFVIADLSNMTKYKRKFKKL